MTGVVRTVVASLGAALSFLSLMSGGPVLAQDSYPNKAIRMVVPFAPGGATDLSARAGADRLARNLGQPVVIDNRVGAGGVVGTVAVAKSPADGYTLLYGASSVMLIGPALDPSTPFDAQRDFTAVGQAAKLPLLLAASGALGVTDLKGLRELLRANPQKYSYGSAGAGSTSHVASAAFAQMIGAPQVVHVPYKGTAPAIIDVIGGRVSYIVDAVGPVAEHIRSGKLVGIAMLGKEHAQLFPNIPNMAEAGLPEFLEHEWNSWLGIFVPKGTAMEIVERLNRELNRATRDPEVTKKLLELGFIPMFGSVADAQAAVAQQAPTWAPLLKRLNIKAGN